MIYLAVIKCAFYSKVVYIRIQHSCHLGFLDRADFTLGVHDEDGDILLSSQAVNGRGSRITAGRADDSQMVSVVFSPLVPPHKKVFEQIPQELQSNILESKSWAVEEFQQMQVLALV